MNQLNQLTLNRNTKLFIKYLDMLKRSERLELIKYLYIDVYCPKCGTKKTKEEENCPCVMLEEGLKRDFHKAFEVYPYD